MRRPDVPNVSTLDTFQLDLKSLKDNGLGEPSQRTIEVWRPQEIPTKGLPWLVCLASYLNSGPSLTGWRLFGENIPQRLNRLYAENKIPPCLIVFVDSFNRLGGTQFVNSSLIGNWVDALGDDLVPAIEARYECGGPGKRGLFGHSSGGYGALYNLAQRPDVWATAASHAGDCGFDFVYRHELPKALRSLSTFGFDAARFLDAFWKQEKPKGEQVSALMMLAMAASYDPPSSTSELSAITLPVTLDTCEFIQERWSKWLDHDLLTVIEQNPTSFQKARALYFDCGLQDEYNILYGSRRAHQLFLQNDIPHHYEEFEGGHGSIGPRYEVSLPKLLHAMT